MVNRTVGTEETLRTPDLRLKFVLVVQEAGLVTSGLGFEIIPLNWHYWANFPDVRFTRQ